jgi:hypothetical protein
MKKIILILFPVLFLLSCHENKKIEVTDIPATVITPQTVEIVDTTIYCKDPVFNSAYKEMKSMLEGKTNPNFKRAVFLIESTYDTTIHYEDFSAHISKIAVDLKAFIKERGVEKYKTSGNFAIFEFFTKPHKMNDFKPFTYDFDDFYGKKDFRNISITKLLRTHKGQCTSMPFLYKILSEEIGAESYLALAPEHCYIKHLDEQGKWVNIELTNGHFSSDAWMISSMEISAESIKKGVYMKELTLKESIALCMVDLGTAYARKKGGFNKFSELCAVESLKYHPTNPSAVIARYCTVRDESYAYMKKHGRKKCPYLVENIAKLKAIDKELEILGFRELSPDAYANWQKGMAEEKLKLAKQN